MPTDLKPALTAIDTAWAKYMAAKRAKGKADGLKAQADYNYEQKVKEKADFAAASGLTRAQKDKFEDQIEALREKKIAAANAAIDAATALEDAEKALAKANFDYHQKLLELLFQK